MTNQAFGASSSFRIDIGHAFCDESVTLLGPEKSLIEFMKRFILAFIAAYVFIFFWGWLLNGVLLKGIYAETPNLWRPAE